MVLVLILMPLDFIELMIYTLHGCSECGLRGATC